MKGAMPIKKRPLQKRSQRRIISITVAGMVLFFFTFFILPIAMALIGSFFQWNPLRSQFRFLGFKNWIDVFANKLFWDSLGNTFFFTMVAVLFRVVIGLGLAIALYSKAIKYKTFYRTIYYLPTITPMVAVAFVWKFIFEPRIGLLNRLLNTNINWLFDSRYALITILILTIWKDFGYSVIILLAGLHSLPAICFEAAEIDGATAWQRFIYITLPLLRPTILFVVITSLISYFQTYIPVMVMTQGGPGTKTYLVSYLIYNQAFINYDFGYASAISFVLFLFVALVSWTSFKISEKETI